MQDTIPILLIAAAGRISESLLALIRTISQVELIGQAEDSATALEIIMRFQPNLVILDANLLDEDLQTFLKQIKSIRSQIKSIVLVSNLHQRGLAQSAGADRLLLTGFSAATFLTTIHDLILETWL